MINYPHITKLSVTDLHTLFPCGGATPLQIVGELLVNKVPSEFVMIDDMADGDICFIVPSLAIPPNYGYNYLLYENDEYYLINFSAGFGCNAFRGDFRKIRKEVDSSLTAFKMMAI